MSVSEELKTVSVSEKLKTVNVKVENLIFDRKLQIFEVVSI